jgi:hypothetical protein
MPRVAAAPLGVLIGLPIAACFAKPAGPQEMATDARTETEVDSRIIAPGTCELDDFSGSAMNNCGTWAFPVSQIVTAGNGSLVLTVPSAPASGIASCQTVQQAFTQVTLNMTAFSPIASYDRLHFYLLADDVRYGAMIHRPGASTNLQTECPGSAFVTTSWSTTNARYIRFRWSPPFLNVQIAGDGTNFTPLGSCTVTTFASTAIGLELERGSGGSAVQASIDYVEVCY